MYYDNSLVNRETWKYTYTGSNLLENAKKLKTKFREQEMNARNELAKLLSDPSVSQDSKEIQQLRNEITSNGKNYEALCVYVHEFERTPGRDFHLSLGDVVFFGLYAV